MCICHSVYVRARVRVRVSVCAHMLLCVCVSLGACLCLRVRLCACVSLCILHGVNLPESARCTKQNSRDAVHRSQNMLSDSPARQKVLCLVTQSALYSLSSPVTLFFVSYFRPKRDTSAQIHSVRGQPVDSCLLLLFFLFIY